MAYYNTCPDCGSNLDPGEKCECRKEKEKQEIFYQRVTRRTPQTGQMVFVFDRKETDYAGKAAY